MRWLLFRGVRPDVAGVAEDLPKALENLKKLLMLSPRSQEENRILSAGELARDWA